MNTRRILCLIVLCGGASAQNPETVVLGGPCLAESDAGFPEWLGLVRRHGQALRRGDRESAVELAKQIVRSRCSNEHWWLKLAESLAEMDRLEESVAALDALYARESNAIDHRLRTPNSPLNRLLESDAYRRSALAARRAADRRALEKRRSEARAKLATEPHPPIDYVAKHACPFECCGFGSWSVLKDTTLYDSPGGTRLVSRVAKGEKVEALTGEVHLRPAPVRVRFGSLYGFTAEEGLIVFLLDYTGEGHGRVWVQGKIVDAEIAAVDEHCAFPEPGCWGEFINPDDAGRQHKRVWWVQVKTAGGATGWTREVGNFGGKDGCA